MENLVVIDIIKGLILTRCSDLIRPGAPVKKSSIIKLNLCVKISVNSKPESSCVSH